MLWFLAEPAGIRAGKKKLTKVFVAENGRFGTPFLTPKTPRKSPCGSLFIAFFPRK